MTDSWPADQIERRRVDKIGKCQTFTNASAERLAVRILFPPNRQRSNRRRTMDGLGSLKASGRDALK